MDQWRMGESEQRKLLEALRRTHDAREYQRTLAVLECGRGKSKSAVARSLNVTRQSVHHWVNRYRRGKQPTALHDAPRSGRPRKADEAVETLVQALMMLSPQRCGYHATHWTIPLLRDQVSKNLDRQCSEMTMRRCLHRLGYVWKRPRYALAPDPQREKKKPTAARTWQLAQAQRGLGGR